MATALPESAETMKENIKSKKKMPTCIIVLGMAGAGKSAFTKKLAEKIKAQGKTPYVINLDPACRNLGYDAKIDIRDAVKYDIVKKEYGLGPNGAIVTSLNLFATKFDQVLTLIDKRAGECDYVVLDTPGQIEVFMWSAAGLIITQGLASLCPTMITYVADAVRSVATATFMSNMVYALAIKYHVKLLPLVLAFNKTDITSHQYAVDRMNDFTVLLDELHKERTYISNLARSLTLELDDLYNKLPVVGVSSHNGDGFEEYFVRVEEAEREYYTDYLPNLQSQSAEKAAARRKEEEDQLERLRRDVTNNGEVPLIPDLSPKKRESEQFHLRPSYYEDQESDDEMADEDEREEKNFSEFVTKK